MGSVDLCQALLQSGANPNATDEEGITPLEASASGAASLAVSGTAPGRWRRCERERPVGKGRPLAYALDEDAREMALFLLAKGAKKQADNAGVTPLMRACTHGEGVTAEAPG